MNPVVNDINHFVKQVFGASEVSYGLGGTSTHVDDDKFGELFDRLALSRRYKSVSVGAAFALTMATSAGLSFEAGIQDTAATSVGPSNFGSRTVTPVKLAGSTSPARAHAQAGVNIQGAKRYIRTVSRLTAFAGATSSGQTALVNGLWATLGGGDETPNT